MPKDALEGDNVTQARDDGITAVDVALEFLIAETISFRCWCLRERFQLVKKRTHGKLQILLSCFFFTIISPKIEKITGLRRCILLLELNIMSPYLGMFNCWKHITSLWGIIASLKDCKEVLK